MKHEVTLAPGLDAASPAPLRPVMVNEVTASPASYSKSAVAARPHILDRRAARWARRAAY